MLNACQEAKEEGNVHTRLMAPDAVHRNTPLVPQVKPPRMGNHLFDCVRPSFQKWFQLLQKDLLVAKCCVRI